MKNIFTIISLFLALSVFGQEINPGITLVDGQRLTASELAQLVNQATIQPPFYTDKISQTNIASTDILLVYSPSSGTFHQVTGANGIFGNVSIISSQIPYTLFGTNAIFLGYDYTNDSLFQVTAANLAGSLTPLIPVASLAFAPTNSSGTNVPALTNWSGSFSGYNTNNPPYFPVFGTNGALEQISWYFMETNSWADGGTNGFIPYEYAFNYAPWTYYTYNGRTNIYGTNSDGSPAFTNLWGYCTNFPITSIYNQTNWVSTSTNSLNLTNTDTLPINSTQQKTNSTVSLAALYQYFTNINALPAYTQARILFSGVPVTLVVSNDANLSANLIHATNNNFTYPNIYCVDFSTNGTPFFTGQTVNTNYYIRPTSTNNAWLNVYSNYTAALNNTPITLTSTGTGGTLDKIYYLTNFTSFNCDACQTVTPPATIRVGIYDLFFRTASPTPYYYFTGSAMDFNNVSMIVGESSDNLITTNVCRIKVQDYGNDGYQSSLVNAIISPQ